MFQVKAKTSTVVIGDFVFQVNTPTIIRGELPEMVGKYEALLEIIELDEECLVPFVATAGGGLTADGIDHTGEGGPDLVVDDVDDVDVDEGGAAPDPFADADELLGPAPAPPVVAPKPAPKTQTRVSRGGRR